MTTEASRPVTWQKSRYSNGGDNCVEWAHLSDGQVAIRDSKDPAGPELVVSVDTWRSFIAQVRTTGSATTGPLVTRDSGTAVQRFKSSAPAVWYILYQVDNVQLHFTADERDAFLTEVHHQADEQETAA